MKSIKYLLGLMALSGAMVSCDSEADPTPNDVQLPYTYSELYYQNLRDFKQTKHPISFGWFSQYGAQNSMAIRFLGLPDSIDIISLWGGIPNEQEDGEIYKEMRFVQKNKGTRMVGVTIARLQAELADKPWKQAFDEAYSMPSGEERDAALTAAVLMYAESFVDETFENDIDGFDIDYEPEGDFLSGNWFHIFYKHMAKWLGPNPDFYEKQEDLGINYTSDDPQAIWQANRNYWIEQRYGKDMDKRYRMLCVDSNGQVDGNATVERYSDYYFRQTYGGGAGSISSWPDQKVVHCCNMGDYWQSADPNGLYGYARWAARSGGGFGAFFIHRDYNVHENNPYPYKRFRECIQIASPAVH